MSLNAAKMSDSLKSQLDQEERELKAELDAVEKQKKRAAKNDDVQEDS